MTGLGVTWSPIAESVRDEVDFIEIPGWELQRVPLDNRILLHNIDLDFSLARSGIIDAGWGQTARDSIRETNSPWLSIHLGFSAELVRFDGHMIPESESLDRATTWSRIRDSLERVKRAIHVPLLIENLDYCPEGAYEHVCEPGFIRDMLETVDCGLLLDLAHARVSADWLGIDIEQYLAILPLERIIEIHLSSPRPLNGRLDDAHDQLTDLDLGLLDDILQMSAPRAVVIEYRRDESELKRQLRDVRAVIRARQADAL